MWKMLHEANAIEAMAISVRFSEPVGAVLAKRMLRDFEDTTVVEGLSDRTPLQGFQVNVANPTDVKPIVGTAMLFRKFSLERNHEGTVEKQLTNQVEMQPTHVNYQTWRYGRWSDELGIALRLLVAPLSRATQGSAIGSVRVEYLDRFYFDGEASAASVDGVLKSQSGWLAPHVFQAPDLWHSHTGKFESVSDDSRRLKLVNVDYQDLSGPVPRLVDKRAIQLMSAVEEQFPDLGREIGGGEMESFLSSLLEELHSSAIDLFKEVVNEKFARENGLPT
jgi:hypothetical protein